MRGGARVCGAADARLDSTAPPSPPRSPRMVAPLIPLTVGATPLPSGPWATQPVIFSGDPAQTARDLRQRSTTWREGTPPSPSAQRAPGRSALATIWRPPRRRPSRPPSSLPRIGTGLARAALSIPRRHIPHSRAIPQYPQGGAPYASAGRAREAPPLAADPRRRRRGRAAALRGRRRPRIRQPPRCRRGRLHWYHPDRNRAGLDASGHRDSDHPGELHRLL